MGKLKKSVLSLVLTAAMLLTAMAVAPLTTLRVEADGATFTDFIVIDQFGYRPDSTKTAVVRNPVQGPDVPASPFVPGSTYQVINEATGLSVHSGTPARQFGTGLDPQVRQNPREWQEPFTMMSASGDQIWWFDFTAVTEPGKYYILDVQRNVRSFSFTIADDVYNDVLKHAVRMFYYQRSGFAKEQPYAEAGWTDTASHLQDKNSRLYSQPNNVALERDLSGGWYDAGDYNKYTVWAADYIESLLTIYRERPEVFGDNYNIPESGNGVPDILDEAKWGMDFLLKMQNDNSVNYSSLGIPSYPTDITNFDGSMLSVVGYGAAGAAPPSNDNLPSRYGPPNTIATISAAKAFALGAIVFDEFDKQYSAQLKTAAIKAYDWAAANPAVYFVNNDESNNSRGLAAGNQDPEPDSTSTNIQPRLVARMQAGFYLYELTNNNSYLLPFEQNNAYQTLPPYAWWTMDMYRFDNHTMYLYYLNLDGNNATIAGNVRERLNIGFNRNDGHLAAKLGNSGYRAHLQMYDWGSNKHIGDTGSTFYYWYKYNVDPSADSSRFKTAAEDYLHYMHGVNPLNTVYLTNMNNKGASRSLDALYHSWFYPGTKWDRVGVSEFGPAPGFVPGGPNGSYNVQDGFPSNLGGYNPTPAERELGNYIQDTLQGSPPKKMYMDINDGWPINTWEITEPMGYYQVSYIRLLSKFAEEANDTNAIEVEVVDVGGRTAIKITNNTIASFSTKGMFLTDTNESFSRQLPAVIIRGGHFVLIYDNNTPAAWKRATVDFPLTVGMRLRLIEANLVKVE